MILLSYLRNLCLRPRTYRFSFMFPYKILLFSLLHLSLYTCYFFLWILSSFFLDLSSSTILCIAVLFFAFMLLGFARILGSISHVFNKFGEFSGIFLPLCFFSFSHSPLLLVPQLHICQLYFFTVPMVLFIFLQFFFSRFSLLHV